MLGTMCEFNVIRETDIGYMIANKTDEFFLHYNECNNRKLETDERIIAFIYKDKKGRLAATLKKPIISFENGASCEVVEVISTGVYVNIGISKDILISDNDLPISTDLWPRRGDMLVCNLGLKNGNLIAKLLSKKDFLLMQTNTDILELNTILSANVYRITEKGINLVDDTYRVYFVYYANLPKKYRLGERVSIKIVKRNVDDYNAIIDEDKEGILKMEVNTILDYLNKHNGIMNFGRDTNPDIIYRIFKMSKGNFKRALTVLYKENKVTLEDEKTILKRENSYDNLF